MQQRQEAQWKVAQERRMQAERDQLQAQLSLLRLQGEAVRELYCRTFARAQQARTTPSMIALESSLVL